MIKDVMDWLKVRTFRFLRYFAEFCQQYDISKDTVTGFSMASGILAIVFLFKIHWLFVVFALLHLFFDNLDGAVARLTRTENEFGAKLDFWVDRGFEFFLLIKAAFFLRSDYAVLAIILIVINYAFFMIAKTDVIYTRSLILIGFLFTLFDITVVLAFITASVSIGWQTVQKAKILI
jgi:phosphatidylglycerophosphate synthase